MSSILRFFIYSNLFIAACAILMVNQTYSLFSSGKNGIYFFAFVFFATICSYSFHWGLTAESLVISPRIVWLKKYRNVHLIFFIVGLIGAAICFYFLLPFWHWLLLSAVITFLYSAPKIPHPFFRALRKLAIGKTIFLSLVWTYVTAVLPLIIAEVDWTTAMTLFVISRFFFIYMICIMFDFRDRPDDKVAGIRSMVTWFSEKGVDRLFFISLIICIISTILLIKYDFTVFTIVILLTPAFIAATIYTYAKSNFSDFLYYFILDGLMMFSALLMLVFRI